MQTPSLSTDTQRFYRLLADLGARTGGRRALSECNGKLSWPARGVYFFFEPGEFQAETKIDLGLRVVRVGTHALKLGARSTLWGRLAQHKGSNRSGGGNHRGSIFRLLIGDALVNRGIHDKIPSWGLKSDIGKAANEVGIDRATLKALEHPLEEAVSNYIGAMPLLWLGINDAAGPESLRGVIERNSIALLSNCYGHAIDPASTEWLGSSSSRERVQRSGLWNNNHVDEAYDPAFLDLLQQLVGRETEKGSDPIFRNDR